jgi:PAS domain S-box-containing protein
MDTSALIHLLSVLLQVAAIVLAFRLIPLTGRRLAWLLLSAAFLLMGLRRVIEYAFEHEAIIMAWHNAIMEISGLVVSLFAVGGVYLMREVFLERKRAEDRFRSVNAAAQDAVVMIDATGKIYVWNDAATRLFGYTPEEAQGGKLHELIVPARFRDAALAGLQRFHETGTGPVIGKTVELVARRKDGTEFPAEHSISALRVDGVWHAVGIVRDITERNASRRKLEKQLDELHRFEKLAVGRELRMQELAEENRVLKDKLAKREQP